MTQQEILDDNLIVLANANAFASEIIKKIAGNAISNTVDGSTINDAYLSTTIATKLNTKLIPYTGV